MILGDDKKVYNADLPEQMLREMIGPIPPDVFASNGCTLSPDGVGPYDLRPACHFHDYSYMLWEFEGRGGTEADRQNADTALYHNLRKCGFSRMAAWWYFAACHMAGHLGYHYKPGQEPKRNLLFRMWLLYTLFVRW